MGSERTTQETQQETTVQQTPEEQELNKLLLERQKAAQAGTIEAQAGGLNLINQLLAGEDLPGFLGQLPGGISPEAIGTQAAQLAGQYGAGFQQMGIGDSGVAFRETARGIGSELLFPAEQFNLQNLSQLLNLAVGGQAQIQAPITAQGGQLSQALAGLRGTTTTGGTTLTQMNPFLKSFQTSLGQTLGGPQVSAGPFTFGG